jgi:hypothetical protein
MTVVLTDWIMQLIASTPRPGTVKMPSFFPSSLHNLPPTPPHVDGSGRMESGRPLFMTGQSAFPSRYTQTGCEFIEQYSQAACFVKPAPLNIPMPAMHHMRNSNGRDLATQSNVAPQSATQPVFGPVTAAPVLPPPIRANNVQLPPMDSTIPPQYRRQDLIVPPEQPVKEEKPTGGVAAHLDYEMDQMSDFVAEMAQGMYALYITKINLADIDFAGSVYPGTPVPPQFRKYVHQILSSTRLPSSTIFLGLFYLASRMRFLSSARMYTPGSGQVYRMLTTALLLGSKFLDDNTFQNKSWAEVSNIPVAELNTMELDWLFAFEWKIHERIHNEQDGFTTFLKQWEKYRAKAAVRLHESRQALTPIDTNLARQHVVPKPLLSPDGPIPPQYQRNQRNAHFETAWLGSATSEYSPPSAPHSGPATPDYFSVGPWAYANGPPLPFSRGWVAPSQQYIPHPPARSSQPASSYRQTPSYTAPFLQTVWTGHGSSCGCLYCAKHHEHYLCTNTFGAMQPVVAG